MRIQIWHVVVLIIAFVLLFGWKNLPNAARSLGESMRVFKSEVDQMKDDGQARKADKDRAAIDERGATSADRLDDRHDRYQEDRYREDRDDRYRDERDHHYRETRDDRYEDSAQREYREANERARRGDDPRA